MSLDKRQFLQLAACAGALPAAALAATPAAATGAPVLLTVSGRIQRGNRGPLDKVVDQMMGKQGVQFERARTFGFAEIAALPSVAIQPTLEYDGRRHRLQGPTVASVLAQAGAPTADDTVVGMRAIDGYNAELTLGELRRLGFIVATHLDGQPMALGGLGPMWAMYEPDRFPELASRPLPERFAKCPWGLYSIHVA